MIVAAASMIPHKTSEKKLYSVCDVVMFDPLKVKVLNKTNPKKTSTPVKAILGIRFLLFTSLNKGIRPGSMRPIKREIV